MKITMYELLGMVKDGKAPKKVKYKDKIYYYHEGYDFNYMYNSSDHSPMDRDKSLFTFDSFKMKDGRRCWNDNAVIDFLNDEVEILEGEKKIPEKLGKYAYVDGDFADVWSRSETLLKDKINEIIDCLDYLKSKGDK